MLLGLLLILVACGNDGPWVDGSQRSLRVTDEFRPNVVSVSAWGSDTPHLGYGLIVGSRGQNVYVVTPHHVAQAARGDVRISLISEPSISIRGSVLPHRWPSIDHGGDVAVVEVGLPSGGSQPRVVRVVDGQQLIRGAAAWQIGRGEQAVVPLVAGLFLRIDPALPNLYELENIFAPPGTSGAPVFGELGFVGMILLRDHGTGVTRVFRSDRILEVLRFWEVPTNFLLASQRTMPLDVRRSSELFRAQDLPLKLSGRNLSSARLETAEEAGGDGAQLFSLAVASERGQRGLTRNLGEARRMYEAAEKAGSASAMVNLAIMYISGKGGLQPNEQRAWSMIADAARLGNRRARVLLAEREFVLTLGAGAEGTRAMATLQFEAEQGDAYAQSGVGSFNLYPIDSTYTADPQKGFVFLQNSARTGQAVGYLAASLGHLHGARAALVAMQEIIRQRDPDGRMSVDQRRDIIGPNLNTIFDPLRLAVQSASMAIERGEPIGFPMRAAAYLAQAALILGMGEDPTALEILALADYTSAAPEDVGEQYEILTKIGSMHSRGQGGLKRDAIEARHWLERAVSAGELGAHVVLGEIHRDGGPGVPQNLAQALEHFKIASSHGYVDAMFNAAELLAYGGPGLPQDERMAINYYQQAAAAGDTEAAEELRRRGLLGGYTPSPGP